MEDFETVLIKQIDAIAAANIFHHTDQSVYNAKKFYMRRVLMLETRHFPLKKMIYCKECVYPKITVLLGIDDDGVCTACKAHKNFLTLSDEKWNERQKV